MPWAIAGSLAAHGVALGVLAGFAGRWAPSASPDAPLTDVVGPSTTLTLALDAPAEPPPPEPVPEPPREPAPEPVPDPGPEPVLEPVPEPTPTPVQVVSPVEVAVAPETVVPTEGIPAEASSADASSAEVVPAPAREPKPDAEGSTSARGVPRAREVPGPVSIAGLQASEARRIVYVIDGSGPMTTCLPFVLQHVSASVGRLSPGQSFAIVISRDPPGVWESSRGPMPRAIESLAADLVRGGPEGAAGARSFLAGVQPAGGTDPLGGLRAALALQPDVIFLLTRQIQRTGVRGDGGVQATLDALEPLNPRDPTTGRRRSVIKAIQFLDPDPTGLLPRLAGAHGDGPDSYLVIERSSLR